MGLRWRVGAPAGYCIAVAARSVVAGPRRRRWSRSIPDGWRRPHASSSVAGIASTKDENPKRKAHEGPSYPDYALTGPPHRSYGPRRRPRGPRYQISALEGPIAYFLAHGVPEQAQQLLSGLGAVHELRRTGRLVVRGGWEERVRADPGRVSGGCRGCGMTDRQGPGGWTRVPRWLPIPAAEPFEAARGLSESRVLQEAEDAPVCLRG
jgi:hypothetical protein